MTPFTYGPWTFSTATAEEIGVLGSVKTGPDDVFDHIDGWRLITVRRPGEQAFQMFALGFVGLREMWAASPPIVGFQEDRVLAGSLVLKLGRQGTTENAYLSEMVRVAIGTTGALR